MTIAEKACRMVYVELIEIKENMSNITIALKSEIAVKRAEVKKMVAQYKEAVAAEKQARAVMKLARSINKENRAVERAAKKAERIAKLEAKLAALKNPVGIKALKANRKPSKVTVLKAA